MPFPSSTRPAAAAPAFAAAPAMAAAPVMPGAMPSMPPATPPVMAAPAPTGPNLWVGVNGTPQLLAYAQYSTLSPSSMAMAENQIGGWKTLADFMPAAPTAGAPLGRAAFAPAPTPIQLPAQGQAQSSANASAFAGIESATVSRRGDFVKDGNYVLRLSAAEMRDLRSGKKAVILETLVIVSSYDPANPAHAECHKEGDSVTIFINKNDSFNGNIKELMIALSGLNAQGQPRPDNDVVTAAEAVSLVSPQQPFAGVLFYIEARTRPMKTDPNKSFTNINYWPMPLAADGSPDLARFAAEIR